MTDRPPHLLDRLSNIIDERARIAAETADIAQDAARALDVMGFSQAFLLSLDIRHLAELVAVVSRLHRQRETNPILRVEDLDALEVVLGTAQAAPEMIQDAARVVDLLRRSLPPRTATHHPPADRSRRHSP